jgi:hypothetical protein
MWHILLQLWAGKNHDTLARVNPGNFTFINKDLGVLYRVVTLLAA